MLFVLRSLRHVIGLEYYLEKLVALLLELVSGDNDHHGDAWSSKEYTPRQALYIFVLNLCLEFDEA